MSARFSQAAATPTHDLFTTISTTAKDDRTSRPGVLPRSVQALEDAWTAVANENPITVQHGIDRRLAVALPPDFFALAASGAPHSTHTISEASSRSSSTSRGSSSPGSSSHDAAPSFWPHDSRSEAHDMLAATARDVLRALGTLCKAALEELAEALVARAMSTESAVAIAELTAAVRTMLPRGQLETDFASAVRMAAMQRIHEHWNLQTGAWNLASGRGALSALRARGTAAAQLLARLFAHALATAEDINLALGLLLNAPPSLDRLCAAHALVVHAGDALYAERNRAFVEEFVACVAVKHGGRYVWGGADGERYIKEIDARVDAGFAAQKARRAREKPLAPKVSLAGLRGDAPIFVPLDEGRGRRHHHGNKYVMAKASTERTKGPRMGVAA